MALTPQNNEAFLREVDDELRRDQLLDFWQRYGRWVVVGIVAALAILAGVLFWQHRQRIAAEKQGEQLQQAYDYLGAGDEGGAAKALGSLATSGSDGYRALAKFTQADVLLKQNKLKEAAAAFGAVAADDSVAAPFRNVALIRQTTAEYDMLKPEVVIQRLGALTAPGSAWLGSAGELVAAAYLRTGQRAEAAKLFARMAKERSVPRSLRQRAVQMAGLLGVDVTDAMPGPGANEGVTAR